MEGLCFHYTLHLSVYVYVFVLVCVCVCVCVCVLVCVCVCKCVYVCVSVCLSVSEQNSRRSNGGNDLDVVFAKWLHTALANTLLKFVTLGQRSRS